MKIAALQIPSGSSNIRYLAKCSEAKQTNLNIIGHIFGYIHISYKRLSESRF